MRTIRYGLACLVALVVGICFQATPVRAGSCCRAPAPPESNASTSPDSLFLLNSSWTNQDGEVVRIDSLAGQVTVIGMFYASCSTVCPRLATEMKRIEQALPEEVRNHTRFVLVSLDPGRDDPSALRAFRDTMKLDPGRWTLWRGSPGDVRALAAALDVTYRVLPDGTISHSAPVAVLNRNGEVAGRVAGLGDPYTALVTRVQELARP